MTMNDQRIRLVVIDDDPAVRRATTQLIHNQPDMMVLDTGSTGREALKLATELQPDVVLMDLYLPDMDGIQTIWLVSSHFPNGSVIIATSEQRIDVMRKAMAAGAQGYVLKP